MILDYLEHIEQYDGVWPKLVEAVKFAQSIADRDLGRYEGEGYYAMIQEVETVPLGSKQYEVHRRYIDVHIPLVGEELMGYEDISKLAPVGEFNEERDIQMLDGEGQPVIIRPGMFSVVFPHDAHSPGCCVAQPGTLKKIVLKVHD